MEKVTSINTCKRHYRYTCINIDLSQYITHSTFVSVRHSVYICHRTLAVNNSFYLLVVFDLQQSIKRFKNILKYVSFIWLNNTNNDWCAPSHNKHLHVYV